MSKALLVVSFGTSFAETRKATLEAIEGALTQAFPDRTFYRAWTSGRILKKLRENGGPVYDTLDEACARMEADGVTDVLVQPTFMLDGFEMKMTADKVAGWTGRFAHIALGRPLLTDAADLEKLTKLLEQTYAGSVAPGDMLALMGHGSDRTDFNVYSLLEYNFRRDGFGRFAVGTVEFTPGFEPVLAQVRQEKPATVWLAPLMVVAGDHATNDMAGPEPDSWKSRLEREGAAVRCILKGMGEYPEIQTMYVEHAKAAAVIA